MILEMHVDKPDRRDEGPWLVRVTVANGTRGMHAEHLGLATLRVGRYKTMDEALQAASSLVGKPFRWTSRSFANPTLECFGLVLSATMANTEEKPNTEVIPCAE